MANFWILLVAAPLLPLQGADLLPRIREKMAQILQRQPDYTCTETVERTRQAVGGTARVEDTLRLEVALVDGKEMFAWPGSKQFEDRELGDLVATGMFGNGNFAIYARILFLSDVAVFEDGGETQLNGLSVRRYDFRVSRSVSGSRLRNGKREGVAGFHGSFYADPMTLDVRRMEIAAEDIPADLGITAAENSVDYGWLTIGDDAFLLPVESKLMMATPDLVNRNWVRFANCRKFTGESTLLFNDPVLTETPAPVPPKEVEIPAHLTLQLEMSGLDLIRAAVGDPVRAKLWADVKNRGQLLAPKGSVASGRIVRLDRSSGNFILQVEFQDLDWPGGHARLKLRFDQPAFSTRLMGRLAGGDIMISRQAGTRLSGILMFWRTE
ncbi:MAG: hypothetical protein LAO55_10185 [Acidobacteriia bacterium]|nr:hypothetical protein [Terriglobia bacterium]